MFEGHCPWVFRPRAYILRYLETYGRVHTAASHWKSCFCFRFFCSMISTQSDIYTTPNNKLDIFEFCIDKRSWHYIQELRQLAFCQKQEISHLKPCESSIDFSSFIVLCSCQYAIGLMSFEDIDKGTPFHEDTLILWLCLLLMILCGC